MERKSHFNGVLSFLPLLGLYIILVFVFSSNELTGDEYRHVRYATNLTQGFYTSSDNPDFRNGPGYPLVLAPFIALKTGPLVPRLLNAIFVFAGILFFFKTLDRYTTRRNAMIAAYMLGLYPPLMRWMVLLYSEALSFMLICCFMYQLCRLYQVQNLHWKNLGLASFFLGFLILTKAIFFHVMVVSIIFTGILIVFSKNRRNEKKALLILAGSMIVVSPFLFYSYSLTGKMFVVGTGGGELLYHRSTPYENELGNWFAADDILEVGNDTQEQPDTYKSLSKLSANHRDVYLRYASLSAIEQDSAFTAQALANMKKYPVKYLKNTVSNIGRFLFNFPHSYKNENMGTFLYVIPNMFVLVLFILILYPAFLARRNIPFEIKAQLLFFSIYCGGMLVLAAKARYFIMVIPSLILTVTFVYTNVLRITMPQLRKEQ